MTSIGGNSTSTLSNNQHEEQPFLRGDAYPQNYGTSSTRSTSNIRDMFIVGLTIVGIVAITNNNQILFRGDPSNSDLSPGAAASSSILSQVALEESYGLLNDVTQDGWNMLKERVRRQRSVEDRTPLTEGIPQEDDNAISKWYGKHFEPEFTCLHEERTGGKHLKGNGDGAKWVCNPRRIKELAQERLIQGNGDQTNNKPCLIYSVGSKGQFDFEEAMVSLTQTNPNDVKSSLCEIHVFDMDDYTHKLSSKYEGTIFYHKWGLTSNAEREQQTNTIKTGLLRRHLQADEREYRSLQEIIKELGHEGRTIDIFKIDCEGCEWRTYQDWLSSNVDIRQIQVEVHEVPQNAVDFFVDIQDAGYVIFHKEPNTLPHKAANYIEYSFLKLQPSFFQY